MSKITVIGSCVADLVVYVDDFPEPGEVVVGHDLKTFLGGKGANQCVAAKRLGAKVEMIGMVGNDNHGKDFIELFKREGISCENVFMRNTLPTSISQIQVNKSGQNKIVNVPGANYGFNSDSIKKVIKNIKESTMVVTQLEFKREIEEEIIRTCKRFGVPVIVNPAPAYPLSQEILECIDYLIPNETELERLSGFPCNTSSNILKAAEKLVQQGVKNLVVTLGSKGALIADAKGMRIIKGFKVKAIDTVGAGDSFIGAIAVMLTRGKSLDEAVQFANAVGALTVTKEGAIPSLPRLRDVQIFLRFAK